MIESANDVNEARKKIMEQLNLNQKQADGILGMPLRKLTTLETQGLYQEVKDLQKKFFDFKSKKEFENEFDFIKGNFLGKG